MRARRSQRGARLHRRGMSLLEVMVSVAILALIGTLIYGAFDGMSKTRTGITRLADRYHQGRAAVARMSREIQSAYLTPIPTNTILQPTRLTGFIGVDSTPSDRLDFTSFSHRRLRADVHESDQNEVGYFASRDPDSDRIDLVRREAKSIDLEPAKGGVIQVLAEDIESFQIAYLDSITGEWTDSWDSNQPAGQLGRLPLQVHITLVMRGGIGDKPVTFSTKVPVAMQTPLTFGAPK
jgi:general secretion pathway protein J